MDVQVSGQIGLLDLRAQRVDQVGGLVLVAVA
jgi:hypothetical protein